MYMAANIELEVKQSFPRSCLMTSRFHDQQLVSKAMQAVLDKSEGKNLACMTRHSGGLDTKHNRSRSLTVH